MDDFGLDRLELTGSLITMEFGPGGRIQQLWASDPNAPEETEEFQFVAPPVAMGEEIAEDYYPGTILIGARTHPDDPWIVARNVRATHVEDEDDSSIVSFEYEFAFLEELRATGRFYEAGGRIPQVVWDISIENRSRRSVEIGELGFPMALNNVLEGFPPSDDGTRELFHDRVHVHKFIGGAASYIFAQRLNGRPPGLMIYPGADTKWEFYNNVPASLHTPYRWDGIPVVYVHSRAAIEREEWGEWFGGHTSTVLEPGEIRNYQIRFAPADRSKIDTVHASLVTNGRPSMKLFPGAVAPVDVGIAMEVTGATPARFWTDVDLELETDADEEGGFCYIKPTEAGQVRIGFEDTAGRESETHLLFTRPIAELIKKRAERIASHQVSEEPGSLLGAIVPTENSTSVLITDATSFSTEFGVVSSLADALYLAEKNTIYPVEQELAVVDRYLEEFVEDDLRNPSDGSVGSTFTSVGGVASGFANQRVYPMVALLYESMARASAAFGGTKRRPEEYLALGAETALALLKLSSRSELALSPAPLMSYLPGLVLELRGHGLIEKADELQKLLRERWNSLGRRYYPFLLDSGWTTEVFEETGAAAAFAGSATLLERVARCSVAARSLAPCWWWYGSDKRWVQEPGSNPAMADKGEICQGATAVANAAMFFRSLDRDYIRLPETQMRLAFGGMLGVWALVREDGEAGMGFCPDAASGHFGMSLTSGDVGIGLYHYLRSAGGYVLPSQTSGLAIFGAHFEIEELNGIEHYTVRPWDGVGRKVVVRQLGMELESVAGRILELQFDARKRRARVTLQNPCERELQSMVRIKGLWGRRCRAGGVDVEALDGVFVVPVNLPAGETVRIEIEVTG